MKHNTTKEFSNKLTYKAAILVMGVLATCTGTGISSAALTPDPGITIVSPAQDTQVEPGGTIHVVIEVDPALLPEVVSIYTKMGTLMFPIDLTQAPYEADVTMPSTWTGPLELFTKVKSSQGPYIGPTLRLNVVPTEVPSGLGMRRYNYYENVPLEPGTEDARELTVYGYFSGDRVLVLSRPGFGVTFESSDANIVTVDQNNLIVPVSPGIAYVTASYQGQSVVSEVTVRDPNSTTDLPPIEHTSNVSIAASGFRKHLPTGLFVQELTLRNDGSLPIAFPVELVLMDLPAGVYLANKTSVTKYSITPLGSPYIGVKVDERSFWSPGTTAKVKMNFRNRDGKPITYTPKVYTAESP